MENQLVVREDIHWYNDIRQTSVLEATSPAVPVMHIAGDLVVEGKLILNGSEKEAIVEETKAALAELLKVKAEIEEMKSKIESMWYAPGMPGYMEAKMSFDEIAEEMKNL